MFPVLFLLGTSLLIFPTVRLPRLGLSPSDLMIFSAFGWLVFESLLPGRGKRQTLIPLHALWLSGILVLIGGIMASTQAARITTSLLITFKICFVLVAWVSMCIVMVRRGHLRAILITFVLAGTMTSLLAIVDHRTGLHLGTRLFASDAEFWTREPGTLGHPNQLGFFLCVSLPLGVGMFLDAWWNHRGIIIWVPLALADFVMAAALFYTGSVAGWLSGLVALTLLGLPWIWKSPITVRIGLAVLLAVSLGVGVVLSTQDSIRGPILDILEYNLERVNAKTGPDRLSLLDEAFQNLNTAPFIGAGLDQSGTGDLGGAELDTRSVIHNTLISSWLNGGILTFLGMAFAYAVTLFTALRALAYGASKNNWVVLGLSAATFAWVIFDQTQPHLYQRFTWITLGLLFGLGFGFQVAVRMPFQPPAGAPLPASSGISAPPPVLAPTRAESGAGQ